MRRLLGILGIAWTTALVLPLSAGAQSDVIRGRVVSAEGGVLANVRVTATSIPGTVTREARTNARGQFQIVFPGASGDYVMGFAVVGYAFRQFEIKRIGEEAVLVADARLARVQLDTVNVVAPVARRVERGAKPSDIGGNDRAVVSDEVPPELAGGLAAMAASLPGVLLVTGPDGAPEGFSVLGVAAEENQTTLNGMRFAGSSLPRDAIVGASLATAPYDPARGGFSGGQLGLVSGAGTNIRRRGASVLFSAPGMQWTDRNARAVGAEFTNVSVGGVVSGPLRRNSVFYAGSYQLSRNTRENQTLLNTAAGGLRTAGVSADSAARLLEILAARSVPVRAGPAAGTRTSDAVAVLLSLDVAPSSSVTGSTYGLSIAANADRQRPVGASVTSLDAAAGERQAWNVNAALRHDAYVGLILTESAVAATRARRAARPYLLLPGGQLLLLSDLGDDVSGVQRLSFGGKQDAGLTTSTTEIEARNTLSWFDDANRHRVRLGTELVLRDESVRDADDLLGTFTFNSLAELSAGAASSYSRTLAPARRSLRSATVAASISDAWRRSDALQIQYGLRVDATRFDGAPSYNSAVERQFAHRNDRLPVPVTISPRVGFSWAIGVSDAPPDLLGLTPPPRATVRGGVGLFTGGVNESLLGDAFRLTGLPDGAQQLTCTGEATPRPDWRAYQSNPANVPARCADGTSGNVFATSAPDVLLVGRAYAPPRAVRSTLSWATDVLDARVAVGVEAAYSAQLRGHRQFDLNFAADPRFRLASEGGRPVFADPASIATATGVIAAGASRVDPAFRRVTEARSDLRASTAQIGVRLRSTSRRAPAVGWSLGYTFTRTRDQSGGFASTGGDPRAMEWASGAQPNQQFTYGIRYNILRVVTVAWTGQLRSGSAFTPIVGGDVNGDGYFNDRAFVFADAGGDSALAGGLRALRTSAPDRVLRCLDAQRGRVAARNSCRGPWSASAVMSLSLDRTRFRIPSRADVSLSVTNPLAAADLALHGPDRVRGWGQNPWPDQTLLYVRGFDAPQGRYRYQVNPRFGATRPQFQSMRAPVTVTMAVRYDLGPTRERQALGEELARGRHIPGTRGTEASLRTTAVARLVNPLIAILRLQDSLRLTSLQADSIAAMNRAYSYRADSLWTLVAAAMAALPDRFAEGPVYERYRDARRAQVALLMDVAASARALLAPRQLHLLPAAAANHLDPGFLASIRDGVGPYVNATRVMR